MHHHQTTQIKIRLRLIHVPLGATLLLAALGFFRNPASAQTSYSLRIYSLGESFAGLIDDPQSDAFLNPARVGDLRDHQLYMAKLPAGSTTFYYPDNYGSMSYAYSSLPPEAPPGEIDYKWPETYTPYTLGFVTPVTETVKLSLSLEAAAKGDDDLEGSEVLQVRGVGDGDRVLMVDGDARGRENNQYHLVADAALGTGDAQSDGLRYGARVRVSYDDMGYGWARVNERIQSRSNNLSDLYRDYDYERDRGEFERTTAQLSIGLARNNGLFAQAVFGGVAQRERLNNDSFFLGIDDEDYDRNGLGFWGDTTPEYRSLNGTYDASRSYDGFLLFARLGLRWGDRVRSFHRVSWGESRGDGSGVTEYDSYTSEAEVSEEYSTISYVIDGATTWFTTDHSVAFIDTITKKVQLAFGVRARIDYQEFEEDGVGTGAVSVNANGSSGSLESPYDQRATHTREHWLLALPMGVEWNLHRNVTWRFGTQIHATRLENDGDLTRELEMIEVAQPDDNLSYQNIDKRITYETSLNFSMGFGFSFRDRFAIDVLTATNTNSFNAATVASAQIKYYF